MGAELVAWKSGRTVVLLVALALIAGFASRPCPKARRTREADLIEQLRRLGPQRELHVLRVRRPDTNRDVCASLGQLSAELRFDEPRMRTFCNVLRRPPVRDLEAESCRAIERLRADLDGRANAAVLAKLDSALNGDCVGMLLAPEIP